MSACVSVALLLVGEGPARRGRPSLSHAANERPSSVSGRPSNVSERPFHASEAGDLASRAPLSRCAAGPESAAKIKGAAEEATAVYTASWTGPPLKRSGGGAMAPVCPSRFYF
jgi:hypothetical protein